MPSLFTEDTYEQAIIELFENMGYEHLYAPDYDRDYTSPLLDSVLRDSLVRINRGLPLDAIEEAISKLSIEIRLKITSMMMILMRITKPMTINYLS